MRVAGGDTLLQPVSTAPVRARYRFHADESPPRDTFGKREVEILRLIAGGYSNREIAQSLFLAEGTVKNYVSAILDKLGTRDRTRAVLKAITLRRTQLRALRLEVVTGLRGIDGLLKHLVNITIISAALAEIIGVLAIVVAFFGGTAWDVVRLGIVGLVVTLYSYPRREAWQRTIDYYAATAPGGSFPRGTSAEGIDDLLGNVAEWTATSGDSFDVGGALEGRAPESFVVRGGSFSSGAAALAAPRSRTLLAAERASARA